MKKALIAITASVFSALMLTTTSFATGNGIVAGAVEGAGEAVEGVVEGAGQAVEGVVEGAGTVVEGAGNTAENIVGVNDNIDDTANDTVTRHDVLAPNNTREGNPHTGVATIPYAMAIGGFGVATVAAFSGRRK